MKSSGESIGEAAARFGLDTHVLRYWEDEGLLRPVRDGAGRRRYGDDDVHGHARHHRRLGGLGPGLEDASLVLCVFFYAPPLLGRLVRSFSLRDDFSCYVRCPCCDCDYERRNELVKRRTKNDSTRMKSAFGLEKYRQLYL